VDIGGAGPGQQRRYDLADALTRARRCDGENVLRTVVTEIAIIEATKHDAALRQQGSVPHIRQVRPAGAARSLETPGSVPPGGSPEGDERGRDATGECQQAGAPEHLGCLGVEGHPPGEQLPRRIDRNAAEADPRVTERRLLPEHGRRPLRRRPYENKCQCGRGDSLQDPTADSGRELGFAVNRGWARALP
jgi:hypothetical protein